MKKRRDGQDPSWLFCSGLASDTFTEGERGRHPEFFKPPLKKLASQIGV
jgi:hypothetical protein